MKSDLIDKYFSCVALLIDGIICISRKDKAARSWGGSFWGSFPPKRALSPQVKRAIAPQRSEELPRKDAKNRRKEWLFHTLIATTATLQEIR